MNVTEGLLSQVSVPFSSNPFDLYSDMLYKAQD